MTPTDTPRLSDAQVLPLRPGNEWTFEGLDAPPTLNPAAARALMNLLLSAQARRAARDAERVAS